MQTFLPYPDFQKTAQCLDNKRLGKQRVEARQIISTLEGKSNGWRNHPAVKMWKGYEDCLKMYYNVICEEWIGRGYKQNMELYPEIFSYKKPYWLGKKKFHISHQSNLIRKKSEHYSKFFRNVPNDLPYFWLEGKRN